MKNFISRFDLSYLYAFIGEATLALTFIFYIAIARVLGPEQYGVLAAAVALAGILSVFIQFGLPALLNREVAAYPETATRLILLFLILESLTSVVVLFVLYPLASFLGYQGKVLLVCYLAVFAEVGRAMIMTLRGAVKGLGWFRFESIAVTSERTTAIGIASIVLFQTQNLILVLATVVIVRFIHVIGILLVLKQRFKISAPIDLEKCIGTLKIAYPFAVSGVFWILYYQIDLVMLKTISTGEETGFYSAAYRILEMFAALPGFAFHVLFTRFAHYKINSPEKLPEQLFKATRLLLLMVTPPILIAGIIQYQLVNIIYGNTFLPAVNSLSFLLPSLAIKMYGSIAEHFLQATGQEKRVPKMLIFAALANILLNAVLIPEFAAVGASIATLISECIWTFLALVILSKVGYTYAGRNIGLISVLSLIITAIPTLMLNGFSPVLGTSLAAFCVFVLARRMRYKYFLTPGT
jgi:O-antigen/teichoic acid export membrane protein